MILRAKKPGTFIMQNAYARVSLPVDVCELAEIPTDIFDPGPLCVQLFY